ncbi:MAG TPA: GNAT family N-acetyltransferase [Cyclobacteriaceae bacterium]|nr:GNAT family N-acetyltransferase [Cyclobacteriaceae bacterium]
MKLSFSIATQEDAHPIADLRNAVAEHLTKQFGHGHWSTMTNERGVQLGISNTSKVLMARHGNKLVGVLTLAQKKPWAIDVTYFTPVKKRVLYLLAMAVNPSEQKSGVGGQLIKEAKRIATDWPAEAIRLDAYDAVAGAGDFYRKSGFNERGRVVYRNVPLIYFEMIL